MTSRSMISEVLLVLNLHRETRVIVDVLSNSSGVGNLCLVTQETCMPGVSKAALTFIKACLVDISGGIAYVH